VGPLAVVPAETTEQVQTAVRLAAAQAVRIVVRGAGTRVSRGLTAVEDRIIILTERMRAIQIDAVTRTAFVHPACPTAR
jgi:glycolate oxidase